VILPRGRLLLTGFNQPSHTFKPGDADCWDSTDGGKSWSFRGTAAKRSDAQANKVHYALGVVRGDLYALAGGYAHAEDKTGKRRQMAAEMTRSTDEGKTWKRLGDFRWDAGAAEEAIPYGTISAGPEGSLRTVVYTSTPRDPKRPAAGSRDEAVMVRSDDEGKTWKRQARLGEDINETVALHLGKGHWIAVARTIARVPARPGDSRGEELRQFRSRDDGKTWADEGLLTGYHCHPAHLLRTADGKLLLSYGNRREPGIEVRWSADEGKSWGKPLRVIDLQAGDLGYPCSAQRSDGRIVTAFYAQGSVLHKGYHAGVVIWKP
jgi:hypothetical protein